MRFFNTAGPIKPEMHYCIPPLERLNMDEVHALIRDAKYFVLHAPRQTGKTSALLTLCDLLNAQDTYRCVYVNVEGGQAARDLEYVRDLGLIASDDPLRIANPIYAEVVPRELTYAAQVGLNEDTAWYVNADGSLNVVKLMTEFQTFFREHSEHWVTRFQYSVRCRGRPSGDF